MTKEWIIQKESNGRFGVVKINDRNGTRITFLTRKEAKKYCDMKNNNKNK